MKRLHVAIAIACLLLAAGCLPVTSKTPVGTTVGLGTDEALYGTWKGRGENDPTPVTFHFVPTQNNSMLAITVSAKHGKDAPEASFYVLQAAKLGNNHFLNVVKMYNADNLEENVLNGSSFTMLYRLRKGTLSLYLLDEDKTKEAIRSGAIAGSLGEGDNGDVAITADAAPLDAFMAKPEAAKLFKLLIVLKRAP